MRPWLLLLLTVCAAARADDMAALLRDRAAIERVYYNHRLGQRPPSEEALPPATLEGLVRLDLKKEAVLRKAYNVTITPALLDAEVQRINTTTRAPDMLAEIKTALGDDPAKFAHVFAKPFLVDRLLRETFDNDDALHGAPRRAAERVRNQLLETSAAKSEILSPKPEGRKKVETRNPRMAGSDGLSLRGDDCGFGNSDFGLLSAFGLRPWSGLNRV